LIYVCNKLSPEQDEEEGVPFANEPNGLAPILFHISIDAD
jgi:hypothetical protein